MNATIEYHTDYACLVLEGEEYTIPLATAQKIASDGITITHIHITD